jgi:hypothetical protein
MGGLLAIVIIAYILFRTRGHWGELFAIGGAVIVGWWIIKLTLGIILAIFGLGLLAYLFTL